MIECENLFNEHIGKNKLIKLLVLISIKLRNSLKCQLFLLFIKSSKISMNKSLNSLNRLFALNIKNTIH